MYYKIFPDTEIVPVNISLSSMSKYHNKLVLSQNISIALRISDTLPEEEKVKTNNYIVSELMKDINVYLVKSDTYKEKK